MQLALEYVVRQVAAMTTQSVQSGSAFPIVSTPLCILVYADFMVILC